MGVMKQPNESKIKKTAQEEAIELDNLVAKNISDKVDTGAEVSVDPEMADMMGAFEEGAISNDEARDARFDSPSTVKNAKEESSKKDKK